MRIVITPNSKGTPAGKLADAELHFTEGPLAGLRLVGFAIWQSQWPTKNGTNLRVTVPSREYTVGSERRRYDLLRSDDPAVTDALRDLILDAYAETTDAALAPEQIARAVQHEARTGQRTMGQRWVDMSPAPPERRAPVANPRPAPARVAAPARRPAPQRPTGTDDDYPF
jgi:hypothetical protein